MSRHGVAAMGACLPGMGKVTAQLAAATVSQLGNLDINWPIGGGRRRFNVAQRVEQ